MWPAPHPALQFIIGSRFGLPCQCYAWFLGPRNQCLCQGHMIQAAVTAGVITEVKLDFTHHAAALAAPTPPDSPSRVRNRSGSLLSSFGGSGEMAERGRVGVRVVGSGPSVSDARHLTKSVRHACQVENRPQFGTWLVIPIVPRRREHQLGGLRQPPGKRFRLLYTNPNIRARFLGRHRLKRRPVETVTGLVHDEMRPIITRAERENELRAVVITTDTELRWRMPGIGTPNPGRHRSLGRRAAAVSLPFRRRRRLWRSVIGMAQFALAIARRIISGPPRSPERRRGAPRPQRWTRT